jgi:pimeloyl-ACP methyl ester carboxylesterase
VAPHWRDDGTLQEGYWQTPEEVQSHFSQAQPEPQVHSTAPVVLVDGYDALQFCSHNQNVVDVFGTLAGLLNSDGEDVLFFDNCSWPSLNIEGLGIALRQAIANFKGGQPVDVVAYSMGGLIARAALSINPAIPIRKLVLIGTPNLGTGWAGLTLRPRGQEMQPNSPFLRNLNSVMQMQGRDVIAIASLVNGLEGDGFVGLWSAALNNISLNGDALTRVLPYCHGSDGLTCTGPSIARVTGEDHPTYQIIRSFLDGTDAWMRIGLSPSQALAAHNRR